LAVSGGFCAAGSRGRASVDVAKEGKANSEAESIKVIQSDALDLLARPVFFTFCFFVVTLSSIGLSSATFLQLMSLVIKVNFSIFHAPG
jgi:3'-phosphoadenosine 5'-phosphosulfate sulfotransferase (PAPS reductase)/FAD synthetase